MTQIFGGLRVLDFSAGMAGPLASMLLADHGADVVKVEPPAGDWARTLPAFVQWNRGKRSVVLDLDDADDLAMARRLALDADVLIADGTRLIGRLGLDEHATQLGNPALIRCAIGGGLEETRGEHAPKAFEGVIAAATGRMSCLDQLSGVQPGTTPDGPVFTAAPIAAYGASQLAVQGIVAALLQRRTTGRGQLVGTSLLHGAVAFVMRQELARGHASGGSVPQLAPATQRGIELCFLTAECADGRYIQMCARQDRHFRDWLRAVGLEDLLHEARYANAPMGISTVADVDELEVQLRERMRTRTQQEWMRTFLEDFDVGADPFLTPTEFLHHPDMVANERIVVVEDPRLGPVRQLGALVQMSATPACISRSAPALGADTAAIRRAGWGSPRPIRQPLTTQVCDTAAPLAGVTILEVAYYIAGPLATTILAEMGARVIKVEPLDGDPYRRTGLQSVKFVQGKESITLDLKRPAGKKVLQQLIDRADVVVHSFRNGAAAKLGLDAPTVLARNGRVVHLNAASYGTRGPQRDRAAFHSTPNALTGGGIKQAGEGNPPVNDSYADPGSALGAATAILFGLWARHVTGSGQSLETTMLTTTGYIHSADMVEFAGQPPWRIADHRQRGLGSRYRLYRCHSGWIFLAAPLDEAWSKVLHVLGRSDLLDATDERATTELEIELSRGDAGKWVDELAPTGAGVTEVFEQPFERWLEDNGLLLPAQHAAYGEYWRLPAKVRFSASQPTLRAACAPGEHSLSVLAELGYSAAECDALLAQGITSRFDAPAG